jgi:hypothetical protein
MFAQRSTSSSRGRFDEAACRIPQELGTEHRRWDQVQGAIRKLNTLLRNSDGLIGFLDVVFPRSLRSR